MNAKGMKKNSFHQEEPPLGLMVKKISHNSAPLKKRSLLCNLPDGQKTTTTTTVRERLKNATSLEVVIVVVVVVAKATDEDDDDEEDDDEEQEDQCAFLCIELGGKF